jgi:hypothetical protein
MKGKGAERMGGERGEDCEILYTIAVELFLVIL